MKWTSVLAGALSIFLLLGCDDSSPGPGGTSDRGAPGFNLNDAGGENGDADTLMTSDQGASIGEDQGIPESDGGPSPVDATPVPQSPAWVDVVFEPARSRYAPGEDAELVATVYDIYGDPIEGAELTYTVDPPERGTLSADNDFSFGTCGTGHVQACHGELCGRIHFVVEDGPPRLLVDAPARGQVLVGEEMRRFVISGTVDDLTPGVRIWVNDAPVDIGDDGRFESEVQATFGLNRVTVMADDGVSSESAFDVRDVLWAPEYIAPLDDGVVVPNAGIMRMDQALFDTGADGQVGPEAQDVDVDGLAHLLEIVLQLIDVGTLLGDAVDLGGDGVGAEILTAALGPVEIDFLVSDQGLELFIRFPNVVVTTGGEINLQGQAISLAGTIQLSVVARVELVLSVTDQFSVEVGETDVVLESLGGDFEAEGFGAVITSAASGITRSIEDAFASVVNDLVRTQIADFTRSALQGLFGDLRDLPLNLDPMIEGVAPTELTLSLYPISAEHVPESFTRYPLRGELRHRSPPAPIENDPGVPTVTDSPWLAEPGVGLGVGLRLSLFNALLHEVWRSGLLRLSAPVPESLALLVESVSVDAKLPPVIAASDGVDDLPLEFQLGELELSVRTPGAEAPDVYRVSLRSGLNIRFNEGALQLVLDDVPDVEAMLTEAGSERPLATGILVVAVQGLVWAQLTDALVGGLDFGFGAIDIDPAALAAFAPRIESVSVTPVFEAAPRYQDGALSLEGTLDMQMSIGPAAAEQP